jgi:hypothetical protein
VPGGAPAMPPADASVRARWRGVRRRAPYAFGLPALRAPGVSARAAASYVLRMTRAGRCACRRHGTAGKTGCGGLQKNREAETGILHARRKARPGGSRRALRRGGPAEHRRVPPRLLRAPQRKRATACDCNPLIGLVGARGFEPPTTCTPCRYATRLRYAPRVWIIAEPPRPGDQARSRSITLRISSRTAPRPAPRPDRAPAFEGSATSSSRRLRAPLIVKPWS